MSKEDLNIMLEDAILIATEAHRGQVDKGGNPYILHPIAVSQRVFPLEHKIVAFLHDVLEDTSITEEELKKSGFSNKILEALRAMTRREGETYSCYCERASQNEISIYVKIADLKENLDKSRLSTVGEKELLAFNSRSKRYQRELEKLEKRLEALTS